MMVQEVREIQLKRRSGSALRAAMACPTLLFFEELNARTVFLARASLRGIVEAKQTSLIMEHHASPPSVRDWRRLTRSMHHRGALDYGTTARTGYGYTHVPRSHRK